MLLYHSHYCERAAQNEHALPTISLRVRSIQHLASSEGHGLTAAGFGIARANWTSAMIDTAVEWSQGPRVTCLACRVSPDPTLPRRAVDGGTLIVLIRCISADATSARASFDRENVGRGRDGKVCLGLPLAGTGPWWRRREVGGGRRGICLRNQDAGG